MIGLDNKTLRWIERLIREDKLIPFYKSKQWRSVRQEALERDNFECQECKRHGKYSRAQNVHHKQELKLRPELALSIDNLECLCIRCHNKIHDKQLNKPKNKPFVNEERW